MRVLQQDPRTDPAFTRRMTVMAIAIASAGLVLVGVVAAIAAHPPAPRIVGERYDAVGAGLLTFDGPAHTDPSVRWIDVGERFFVTTYGSSSCPEAPTGVSVEDGGLRIEMVVTGGSACTEDLAPTSYALDVPDELRGRQEIDVVLEAEGGVRTESRLQP